jgi:hypothetical protein
VFPSTSRYAGIEIAERRAPDGRLVRYVRRRLLPAVPREPAATEHVVVQGERLDNITARHLEDPELFWRLCDANGALHPAELTARVGRRLRIPSPLEV